MNFLYIIGEIVMTNKSTNVKREKSKRGNPSMQKEKIRGFGKKGEERINERGKFSVKDE